MAIMKKVFIGFLIISLLTVSMGCAEWNRTAKGAAIGVGGAAGGLMGYATGNTAAGVLIGAAVGGAAGAFIGNYMDKQAAEIEKDIEGAKVERVGEGITDGGRAQNRRVEIAIWANEKLKKVAQEKTS